MQIEYIATQTRTLSYSLEKLIFCINFLWNLLRVRRNPIDLVSCEIIYLEKILSPELIPKRDYV